VKFLLAAVIEAYEAKHWPIELADPSQTRPDHLDQ
jgi:hypothetical protein